MQEAQYWGPYGQWGPFTAQLDGWPNRGEVIRKYRKLKKMSAKRLGELYGDATEGKRIGERWIQKMEKENLVPRDESRRKALASILGVPPILLGLGTLADMLPTNTAAQVSQTDRATLVKQINGDALKQYDAFLTLYWKLDYSSTAKDSLAHVEGLINDLRSFVPLLNSIEKAQVFELLCGFYPLASTIYSDQRNYVKSLEHANNAVSLAEHLENNRLRALAQYQRGFVSLQQGIVTNKQQLISLAIEDFDAALPLASPQVEASILLDLGWARSLKRTSYDATRALKNIDAAETIVGRGRFIDGTFMDVYANINAGKCNLGRAITLIEIRHFEDANDELEEAERTIAYDHTRRRAYIDMLWAKLHVGQRSYAVSVEHALNAIAMSKSIHSVATLAMLKDVHAQLSSSNYGNTKMVRDLGAALVLP